MSQCYIHFGKILVTVESIDQLIAGAENYLKFHSMQQECDFKALRDLKKTLGCLRYTSGPLLPRK